ncbi:MAG: hypothetical protein J6M47_00160 [Clostridia bacterium]|nr:hypothetical protein [Clostridia bacterium]
MINLILAIVSSMLVSVTMRASERRAKNNISMLAMNYLMCTLLSAAFAGTAEIFPAQEGLGAALLLGVVSGAMYLGSFLLLQWNICVNGVVLPATFMKLGVLVPTLLSVVLFGETPTAAQVTGFALAVAAIILIRMERGQGRARHAAGLVVLLLGGGLTDSLSKVYEVFGAPALEDHYLLYTFAVACLLCAGLALLRRQGMTLWDALCGMLIGVPNYFSARFLLLSLSQVPAVVAYPTYSVATIVLITVVGMLAFGERLTRRQKLAMGVILVALVLLNL